MALIGSVTGLNTSLIGKLQNTLPNEGLGKAGLAGFADKAALSSVGAPSQGVEGFSKVIEGIVDTVAAKQDKAASLTREVLLGESDQIHQSVIAMQEASVAFSLMIEVRNKLVDSYQELMRLPV